VRQQSSYRIGRVVLNPARIETGKNEIILHEPAAKLVLHAAETKSRADLADSSLDAIEQNRPTECSSAATLTLFTAGVHFSSVNLVHVLPRPRMMPSLLGMATSNGRAESTGSRHGNGRALP